MFLYHWNPFFLEVSFRWIIDGFVNSSPTSAAYMRQGTKLFFHENTYENVICEMMAILSRGRWVNT